MGYTFFALRVLFILSLLSLVHGWISTHKHEPEYTARLGEIANLVEYRKNNTEDNEMVLMFDTGDLTQV